MKYVKLNNGISMPILGFGVYQIKDQAVCEASVLTALEVGYRSIDTAALYENEVAVGKALKKSGIKREELFITTKLWVSDVTYEKALKAFDASLKRLQLSYVDLYLIHQPYNDIYGAWRAMEELSKKGLAKSIGISNFTPDRAYDLMLFNKIKPAVNQIELHPFHQQKESQKFLKEQNIQLESWGPFAEGKNDFFKNEVLTKIGKKYNKSVAQVALRWQIDNNIVAIPKSETKSRIAENFDIFDFELSKDDISAIEKLDTNKSLFLDHTSTEMVKWFAGRVLDI